MRGRINLRLSFNFGKPLKEGGKNKQHSERYLQEFSNFIIEELNLDVLDEGDEMKYEIDWELIESGDDIE